MRRCFSVRGPGPESKSSSLGLIALIASALALAGCAGGDASGVEGPVTVYVSLPLTGPASGAGRDASDGARLALEQAGREAGGLEVRARFLDDARGRVWDPVAVGENARRAVQDTSTAAYIGELDSGPTRASLPITNEAGIPQVSPGAGAVDLTAPALGYPDSPDRYQPSGEASFARVIPSDAVVATGAIKWLTEHGYTSVAEAPGARDPWAALVVDAFESEARNEGLEIRSPQGPGSGDAGKGTLRLTEAPGEPFLLIDTATGTIGFSPALEARSLPPRGRRMARDFAGRYGREPGPFAAYGYEAMAAVLAALGGRSRDADNFRTAVRDALFEVERPDSVLGAYSLTEVGDTTLCRIQVYEEGVAPQRDTVCAPE